MKHKRVCSFGTFFVVMITVTTILPNFAFAEDAVRPTWSRSLSETLDVINANFLGKAIHCEAVSEEQKEQAFHTLRAQQLETCGEPLTQDEDRRTPEAREKLACFRRVYNTFDRRPYYGGLRFEPHVYVTMSNAGSPFTERVTSNLSMGTNWMSGGRGQMTIQNDNTVSISYLYDSTFDLSVDTLKFDPYLAATQPLDFSATYVTTFYVKGGRSSTGIEGQIVGIHVHAVRCQNK